MDGFPTFITEFVIFSFRGAVRINVNASQTVVCPSCEAKITRRINAELAAYPLVRSHVIMVIQRIECRIFGTALML